MSAANFFQQTATLKAKTAINDYGDPSFGAASTIKCKFVDKQVKRFDAKGQEIVYDSKMYVKHSQSISSGGLVTFNSVGYEIMAVETQTGTVTSLKHKIILLKRTKQV